jgi:hypothetical protein
LRAIRAEAASSWRWLLACLLLTFATPPQQHSWWTASPFGYARASDRQVIAAPRVRASEPAIAPAIEGAAFAPAHASLGRVPASPRVATLPRLYLVNCALLR